MRGRIKNYYIDGMTGFDDKYYVNRYNNGLGTYNL